MSKLTNGDYEMGVLGGLIKYKGMLQDNEGDLSEELFYYDNHKDIFRAIMYLYKQDKPLTKAGVSERLNQLDLLDEVGGKQYIDSLEDEIPNKYFLVPYIGELKELTYKRMVVESAQQLIEGTESGEDINTLLDKFERTTEAPEASQDNNSLGDIMADIFNELESGSVIDKV